MLPIPEVGGRARNIITSTLEEAGMVRATKVPWLPRQTLCGGKIKRKMAKLNQFQALTMVVSHKGDHPITNCSRSINKHPHGFKES